MNKFLSILLAVIYGTLPLPSVTTIEYVEVTPTPEPEYVCYADNYTATEEYQDGTDVSLEDLY